MPALYSQPSFGEQAYRFRVSLAFLFKNPFRRAAVRRPLSPASLTLASVMTALAVGLAKREGRTTVTAHVYINNVPGIIAYTLSIMLPVYLQTRDQELAWRVGAAEDSDSPPRRPRQS